MWCVVFILIDVLLQGLTSDTQLYCGAGIVNMYSYDQLAMVLNGCKEKRNSSCSYVSLNRSSWLRVSLVRRVESSQLAQ